ncbi:Leucine-rich repeat extensin-like protein 6 [Striga hermonthica]|uniref:Cell wall hydroxyproline-rich glycoprotein n=1 Tax=Striga hermonthica TaxID=68872 RepID=A0A9N7N845_STRHE|nr:Leucine-rich repeat extensin-like protein 6 [Striga hermonthica]
MKNISLTLLVLFLHLIPLISSQPFTLTQFQNPRLFQAYQALQAWKLAITSDPQNFTSNWVGCNVCNYTGVFCAPSPDDNSTTTVAGIDLNRASISGILPSDLGKLTDLAVFHLNSNRFTGTIPYAFQSLRLLYELDLSNNLFSGGFPDVVLSLPSLKFLDIRFNQFQGAVPSGMFDLKLDALFINNNNFQMTIPKNIGNLPVSVLVIANNNFQGSCLPKEIGNMGGTLQEIILMNASLGGCLPDEIGSLTQLTVFDVSFNNLVGSLPESMGNMRGLEQLNVAGNRLSGDIPESICRLPRLENFTYSGNYFFREPSSCLKLKEKDDAGNCIPFRPRQRSVDECEHYYSRPVDCTAFGCSPRRVNKHP